MRSKLPLREKGQYALAFGVIAMMLYVVGFPVFMLFFLGVLAYFVWKAFSPRSRSSTRQIFEFYLSANEIIREDGRHWYGFEIQETIAHGETILKMMATAPPLVHFGLGALYQKAGDHSSAVKHLAYVVEDSRSDEAAIVFPTKELREYVRMLRKIERSPEESPLTSGSIRSLEDVWQTRGPEMLAAARAKADGQQPKLQEQESLADNKMPVTDARLEENTTDTERGITYSFSDFANSKRPANIKSPIEDRKTISELLHDIYDEKAQ